MPEETIVKWLNALISEKLRLSFSPGGLHLPNEARTSLEIEPNPTVPQIR
jgi:hypothetical protein